MNIIDINEHRARPRALFFSPSVVMNDSRALRIIQLLKEAGYEVDCVGYQGAPDSPPPPPPNFHLIPAPGMNIRKWVKETWSLVRSRILPHHQAMRVLSTRPLMRKSANMCNRLAEKNDYSLYVAKHWSSLPALLSLKNKGKPVPIWLDINEVFLSEHDASPAWRMFYQPCISRVLKWAENSISIKTITSLAQKLEQENADVLYLPNTKIRPAKLSQDLLGNESGDTIELLYHGLIAPNRAIESIINALAASQNTALRLTIMGHGRAKYVAGLEALAERSGVSDRVTFLPAIKNSNLIEKVTQFDVGLCLFHGNSPQTELSEPNKIYEYIAAHIGVIVSDTPTLRRIVYEGAIGRVMDSPDHDALTKEFDALTKQNARKWQNASKQVQSRLAEERYDADKLLDLLKSQSGAVQNDFFTTEPIEVMSRQAVS